MEHINLEDFINNSRKCTIEFGDNKWVFEEPSIEQLLEVKDKTDGSLLAKKMMIEGDRDEFDKICKKMTGANQAELFKSILDKLGLGGRLQKAS